ncbi:hypothetical protein BKA66DRAFT_428098 [Pyrenochaeta sp. MPI-SDFR-AT-0127]|nr:hypothetical protein BKA66DRAFT_428098 [Pyrenochaeta sp. MPI-SDFR-AT-0127]
MQFFFSLSLAALAAASPLVRQTNSKSLVSCPVIFDGRVTTNLTLTSFDSAETSPFNPGFVKGENRTWSSILLLPNRTARSRFDTTKVHRPVEVTVDDGSLFRAGPNLQVGFRRAGLLYKDDANDPGDATDSGVVTFHWSVLQDTARPLNLSHEYLNVWHERADFSGNQFSFLGGALLGSTGVPTKEEKESWKLQNSKNEVIFKTPISFNKWQNFAVQLDHAKDTIQVFHSSGRSKLAPVTEVLPNSNAGGGQFQFGIGKKPTETKTVTSDGFQEPIPLRGEGQIYSGVFVENSANGCISL